MTANATQVGGTHYKNAYEHWDFAAHLKMGYFEGQIVKYLTRHRSKKGLEDVMKAQHFAVKLIELVRGGQQPMHAYPTSDMLHEYRVANNLGDEEMACIVDVVTWHFMPDLHRLLVSIDMLLRVRYGVNQASREPNASTLLSDTDGSGAGTGYVNQG